MDTGTTEQNTEHGHEHPRDPHPEGGSHQGHKGHQHHRGHNGHDHQPHHARMVVDFRRRLGRMK